MIQWDEFKDWKTTAWEVRLCRDGCTEYRQYYKHAFIRVGYFGGTLEHCWLIHEHSDKSFNPPCYLKKGLPSFEHVMKDLDRFLGEK